jgi:4-hydroxythreonine-4-phosphate dehydrogenase
MKESNEKPVVALTLGDPAGIGPELIARLLARPETLAQANVVLVGDAWLWEDGQRIAGMRIGCDPVSSFDQVRRRGDTSRAAFLAVDTVQPAQVQRGQAQAVGGASVLAVLDRCLAASRAGHIDAICFAPLNKYAMKLGGLKHEDELHHFAAALGVTGYFCEFNTLDSLWTARVSSHVPLKDAASYLSRERIVAATRLIHESLRANGIAAPRVAVAAFNPHGGEGGTCGREEIDIIAPAVAKAAARGIACKGPFPADTVFIKGFGDDYDGVLTMYHDQGQIATKLKGFNRGVTVTGGLDTVFATPAHGTAFDIVGKGVATTGALEQAVRLAARLAASRANASSRGRSTAAASPL